MKLLKWIKSLFEVSEEKRLKLLNAELRYLESVKQLERIKKATDFIKKSNDTSDSKLREIYREE